MSRRFDRWSMIVVLLTLVLFVIAPFITGFTHDLLLETAVFLVSVKLILISRRSIYLAEQTHQRLDQIYDLLSNKQG